MMNRILSLLPESLLLKIYPKGQMFNIFRQVSAQITLSHTKF